MTRKPISVFSSIFDLFSTPNSKFVIIGAWNDKWVHTLLTPIPRKPLQICKTLSTILALRNIKIKYVPLCPTQALRQNPCRWVSVLLEYRSLIQQAWKKKKKEKRTLRKMWRVFLELSSASTSILQMLPCQIKSEHGTVYINSLTRTFWFYNGDHGMRS